MIKQIEKYYKEKGIYPIGFHCKHYSTCVSNAHEKEKFTTGHGIWIGSEYQKGEVPRLLFLSLDSGTAEQDPNKRTMEAARRFSKEWVPIAGDKPKHWYRTHQFAWHVFHELSKALDIELEIGIVDGNHDFSPVNEIHKIKPYFAATNSAKCCMNNQYRSQADSILFENCREYIIGELRVLDPDILVTQGKYARMVAENMAVKKILKKINISRASKTEEDFHILQLPNNKKLVWIHHYHPNNYGTFKKNRDNYATYSKKTAQFFKKGNTEKINILKKKNVKFVSGAVPDRSNQKANNKKAGKYNNSEKPSKKTIKTQVNLDPARQSNQSLLAYHFYNETRYREGKPPDIIVSEIDRLFMQGQDSIKIDELIAIIDKRNPLLKDKLKDVGDKVKKMVYWARSKGLVEFDGDYVKILPG